MVHSVNLTWATSTGSTQWHHFIIAGVIPCPHRPGLFSGKLTKGKVVRLIFCMPSYRCAKAFLEKPVPNLRRKRARPADITHQQSAEVLAAAFGRGVAADHELLGLGQLDFNPGAVVPTRLVVRIRSLGDQALELELPRDLEQLFSIRTLSQRLDKR